MLTLPTAPNEAPSAQTWAGKNVVLQGSNSAQMTGVSGMIPPQTIIHGPASGPVIRIGADDTGAGRLQIHGRVRLENLGLIGQEVALTVTNAAGIYVRNCGFRAKRNTSSPDNAAVIISNAFEVFFEHSSFQGPAEWKLGEVRKPSLLLRGTAGGPHPPLCTNWFFRFSTCSWGPGAILL